MYWKETGDLSVWTGIAQDSIIMNIDDLICVGATDNILVSSTIGRNKNLIPGEVRPTTHVLHETKRVEAKQNGCPNQRPEQTQGHPASWYHAYLD